MRTQIIYTGEECNNIFRLFFYPKSAIRQKKIIKSMKMAFGIALQNNPDKVYARLQNSLFSFSSITLKKVLRDTLQNILTLILVE